MAGTGTEHFWMIESNPHLHTIFMASFSLGIRQISQMVSKLFDWPFLCKSDSIHLVIIRFFRSKRQTIQPIVYRVSKQPIAKFGGIFFQKSVINWENHFHLPVTFDYILWPNPKGQLYSPKIIFHLLLPHITWSFTVKQVLQLWMYHNSKFKAIKSVLRMGRHNFISFCPFNPKNSCPNNFCPF